ncbi:hypothetical protein ACFLWG_01745 [Chloroflexota bacterium]
MTLFATITMLLFYVLAVCTIGGTLASGFTFGFAITAAILEVTVGMIIARAMYRSHKVAAK